MDQAVLERFHLLLRESKNIVFFGGAGVSTESGIPDFRSKDGLYRQTYRYPPETIISHDFFCLHPEEFFRFYRDKMLWPQARPNAAHLALARLEEEGRLRGVVTQNIDGLHQAAGSKNVLELHGSVHRNTCQGCGKKYGLDFILQSAGIPRCSCGGIVKPDVVLYGENLDTATLQQSAALIKAADVLIVGGTSLAVYPAAGLVDMYRGRSLALINLTPTPYDWRADLIIQCRIGNAFEAVLNSECSR